jgi:hypothetical protein
MSTLYDGVTHEWHTAPSEARREGYHGEIIQHGLPPVGSGAERAKDSVGDHGYVGPCHWSGAERWRLVLMDNGYSRFANSRGAATSNSGRI